MGSLCVLFNRIRAVDRLLPNKKVFILHGLFLSVYILLMIAQHGINLYVRFNECLDNCFYLYIASHDILSTTGIVCNFFAYGVVLYMLVPKARQQAQATQRNSEINFMMLNGLNSVESI